MKPTAFVLFLLTTLLLGGCYTQFAATSDTEAPEQAVETPAPVAVQPVVPILILDPTIYVPPPVYYPLPIGASAGGSTGSQKPAESTTRDIGNHRGESGSAGSNSGGRTTGSRR